MNRPDPATFRSIVPSRPLPLLACTALLGVVVVALPAQAGPRWPTWPTEVEQVAAPLRGKTQGPGEGDRVRALSELERFATPVIIKPIVAALDDASPGVRREALRICWTRQIRACIPAASRIWGQGVDPNLRVSALRVLALDPDPSRLAILLGALRDPSDELRAETAEILGWAPLSGAGAKEARVALLAKLSDSSATVRRRAVESLGLLGPGSGTLAMARLLDDPEPTVRSAAATALARARDPNAAPPLLRAIESPNEAVVAQSILDALALVPGNDVPPALLHALDDPPEGLSAYKVAEAIGVRPAPEPALIRGLIARLREAKLRQPVLRALLLLGEPTRQHLQEALDRGLDPALQIEVEGLIDALDPPRTPVDTGRSWPALDDVGRWRHRLSVGRPSDTIEAALALGKRMPSWLPSVAARRIVAHEHPGPVRPWLVALATAERPELGGEWLARARLIGWARDEGLAPTDRCLAMHVASLPGASRWKKKIAEELAPLLADPDPAIRACLVLSAAATDEDVGWARLGLLDPSPRVRTAASLSLAASRNLDASARGRLTVMATVDPDPRVRAASRHALLDRPVDAKTPRATFVQEPAPAYPWADPMRWVAVQTAETTLWVPAMSLGELRWAIVPRLRRQERPSELVPR